MMRVVRRVVSAVLALAVLALSVITLVEVVLRALGRSAWVVDEQRIREALGARQWDDPDVLLTWGVLLLLGLGLLAVAVIRGRPRTVVLNSDGTHAAHLRVRRRSLERYLAGVATAQPGVHGARAAVRRGRVRVRADSAPGSTADVRERVHRAVSDRVQSLDPSPTLATSVSVRSREG